MKNNKIPMSYRLNDETVKGISLIKDKIKKNHNIKLSNGEIIDLLVNAALEKNFDLSIKII